jgi:hypothetical protein
MTAIDALGDEAALNQQCANALAGVVLDTHWYDTCERALEVLLELGAVAQLQQLLRCFVADFWDSGERGGERSTKLRARAVSARLEDLGLPGRQWLSRDEFRKLDCLLAA